jgi:RHS repeat-associated protein
VHEQDGFFRSGGACAELGGTGFPTSQFTNDTSGYSKGSLTGSAVTVSGSSTKIYKGYYYDVKGRVTKVVQNNLLGGYDVTNTVYTFTGQPATVTHSHTASGKSTRTEVYTYSYDHADRVSKVEHTLGGTKITLADYTYDSFGRLSTKSLHGSAANKLTYAYNLRSWLTGITSTRFTQNLYYNTGVGTARYNGNISSMTWKSGNESTVRGYKFTYDGLDRMLNATYGETAGISTNANRFSENVTGYDKNGNIKGLQRYGQLSSTAYGMIDNLTLTLNGNQLNRVDDAVTASAYNGGFEFKNGANAADEYSYDANGNLTKDLNKGISGITYNFLNLPNAVTFSDGSTITYTYGADGTKLRTVHKIGSTTTTTDYCGNVIYENGVQKLLLTEEGYITLSDSKYHYYLKDHQGNNRVVISQSGTVEETSHYYPFGGTFASAGNVQPYKYNGKEYDSKKGLNWYDYGARHYDAALGRFETVDPSAENYFKISLYAYCGNSPISRIDPTGADWYEDKQGNLRWQEGSEALKGYTNIGSSASIALGNDNYLNFYQNGGILANQAVNAFDLIASCGKLQNQFLGKTSPLSEDSKSALFNSLNSRSIDAIARPIGEAAFGFGAGEFGGMLLGKAIGWAVGKVAGRGTQNAIQSTAHGVQRIAGTTATRGGVLSVNEVRVTKSVGKAFTQADGATVYLHEITPGRFNAVVEGRKGIITTMGNWSQKSINRIAKNYGWNIK